ncbi:PREDICTED: uncharacterized protein LOC109216027 [Nicotiana attenuata]|uniref:uncharacterized protein LOC109216027 n=1 Tax=Nicotiana attenuata TaxID=49451 RepID=UPI000904C493|nr:PREDICTED: uncharacterized protein LOC109216027 [Nicotiana attenuata]
MGYNSKFTPKGNTNSFKRSPTDRMDNYRRKRLTPAKMDDNRAKGFRFFCDEKFAVGHKCKAKSLEEHLEHLKVAFELLFKHQLLEKRSKRVFAAKKMEYLGHYISTHRVSTDPRKIKTVKLCPEPKNVTQLRRFHGLESYYRKFIKGYGIINKPLTGLLKKDGFCWTKKTSEAFNKLKVDLTTATVLVLPDFSLTFLVDIDACNVGIGVVLVQKGQHIAFLSK